jgi:hypothetical protein
LFSSVLLQFDVNLDFFLRQIKPPDVQEKYMIGEKETTEHGVTLVLDAPLLLQTSDPIFVFH